MSFGRKWKNWGGTERYWATDNVVSHGPFEDEEEAYEVFLSREGREPLQVVRGRQTSRGHIEGTVAWESEEAWGGTTAFGAAQRDYYVVGYYAGDVPRRDFRRPGSRPRGFVYGSFGTKAQAEKHAKFLQKKAGGQAAHTIYEAVPYERAVRMFDLRV